MPQVAPKISDEAMTMLKDLSLDYLSSPTTVARKLLERAISAEYIKNKKRS